MKSSFKKRLITFIGIINFYLLLLSAFYSLFIHKSECQTFAAYFDRVISKEIEVVLKELR